MFASEGKSISKVTNSLLRTIFSDTFASNYSWKGQKEKKKLENYKIFKVIISNYFYYSYYNILYLLFKYP